MRNDFEANVIQTIRYFSFFNYPPNFEEVYTFLKKKTSKKHLASILGKMRKKRVLISKKNPYLYTLPQYSNYFGNRLLRQQISKRKIQKIQTFLRIISWFPEIQLVGLSGTVAMMNAKEKDDIDLFVIAARNRLFTGRFITLILAELFGLRRTREKSARHHVFSTASPQRGPRRLSQKQVSLLFKNKVCLNLFFDESNLRVPKFKQTEYVAHEVLQMKPLINKGNTYERFLAANRWVFRIFPNARQIFNSQFPIFNQSSISNFQFPKFIGDILENMLKKLELTIIKQHQTSETITDSQLWFHPEDFEKKIKLN